MVVYALVITTIWTSIRRSFDGRYYYIIYIGQGCSVARTLEVHTGLLHYCIFGPEAANDAQNVRVIRVRGKDKDQQNISKMIM